MIFLASRLFPSLFCAALLLTSAAQAADTSVAFAAPRDGAVVVSPFVVKFTVVGMEIRPAGDMTPNTGHHHLLINHGAIAKDVVIPMDDTHLHYGKGQTETKITLPPGKYGLTLQFANGAHQSYGPSMSQTINITVK